jgi:hypothetical protein
MDSILLQYFFLLSLSAFSAVSSFSLHISYSVDKTASFHSTNLVVCYRSRRINHVSFIIYT